MLRPTPILLLTALVLAGCARVTIDPAAVPAEPGAAALRADVAWLSADARAGRETGTPGFDSAAAFVARRYANLGAKPAPGATDYLQRFTARAVLARGEAPVALPTQNVVAMIPGTDPALASEFVVLGAHLDHLGSSPTSARDPGYPIRNGADDNASGTVAVMELARRLTRQPTRRPVIVVHFSGEELGLLGSAYFVENSPVPLAQVQAMLNFDMVGRLNRDRLIVYGTGTAAELPVLVDSVSAGSGLVVNKVPDGVGPSDHSSFSTKGVPVLHFFTDIHPDYHTATDDVARINEAGMVRVIDVAERMARALADRPARLVMLHAAVATGPAMGGRQSSGVYFGSVPDMGSADVVGMKLSGVRDGSPAAKAGIRAGDVVVEFGGRPVKDIYEYTDAMNSFKPDDVIDVVILRDGKRMTVKVTLGRRGG